MFVHDGRADQEISIDADGFLTVRGDDEGVMLRSVEVQQVVDREDGTCVLTSPDGQSVVVGEPLGAFDYDVASERYVVEVATRLRVERQIAGLSELGLVTDSIRVLMAASVKSGNPVHWC